MKKIIGILLLSIPLFVLAQDRKIPVNDKTGKAEIINVVDLTGTSSSDMYERSLKWIDDFYPNPTGTIQEKVANESVYCKARFKVIIKDKKGQTVRQSFIRYKLKLDFKDDKYRYSIYDIEWERSSSFDVSEWEDTDDPRYEADVYPVYVDQTMDYLNNLIETMTKAIATPIEEESSDW